MSDSVVVGNMSERLLLWDQASSAYKVTEAGRTAVIEIELELHRAKKDDILNKIKSKGANKGSYVCLCERVCE